MTVAILGTRWNRSNIGIYFERNVSNTTDQFYLPNTRSGRNVFPSIGIA